jgi:hypothetical protein
MYQTHCIRLMAVLGLLGFFSNMQPRLRTFILHDSNHGFCYTCGTQLVETKPVWLHKSDPIFITSDSKVRS